MTTERKHDPRWRDNTRNERQRRRQAALDAAAQAAGFTTWSKLETAMINKGNHIYIVGMNWSDNQFYGPVAIVCASSKDEALKIRPKTQYADSVAEWGEIDELSAIHIGIADENIETGVLFFSGAYESD